MIHITDAIAIEEREVEESFVRAGGRGGQNAVQLRFDIQRSPSLPDVCWHAWSNWRAAG